MDDAQIGRLAGGQHGVVTRRQLRQLGLTDRSIDGRLRRGRLIRLHRGIFAVGHTSLPREGPWLAAVLAHGALAALSHGTALAAWALRDTPAAWVDVTVATDAGLTHRRGIRLFRHRDLRPEEITTWRGIPITTVPRSLLDAATILAPHALRRATEAAFREHGVSVETMRRLLSAHPRRVGAPALRTIVDDFAAFGVTFTRSDLESLILQLCLDGGLPRPLINRVREREIDCRWPDHGLIVELDGYATHQGRAKFVADRARNRQHVLRGETILAYTHWDLMDQPARVVAEIRAVLARLAS